MTRRPVVSVVMALAVIAAVVSTLDGFRLSAASRQDATPTSTSGDLGARISALETRVARIDPVVGASPGTAQQVSPVAATTRIGAPSPVASGYPISVSGNASGFLDFRPYGQLGVAASGPVHGAGIPVIVHNNTLRAKASIQVSAEVRDAGGNLIATGTSHQFMPPIVQPEDFAIGGVGFGGQTLPEGASVTFEVSASDDVGLYSARWPIPLSLSEFTALPDRIEGSLQNSTEIAVKGDVFITIACFSDDGVLVAVEHTTGTTKDLAPGEKTTFQAFLQGSVPPCNRYLITGYGNSK